MKEVFTLYRELREHQLKLLNSFTLGELAIIPTGFRNNILWNIAHCVVTQQLYCYANSDLPIYLGDDFIAKYRKSTVPDGHVPIATEIRGVRSLMFSTLDHSEADYAKEIFKYYNHYLTGIEYPLTNIGETIYSSISHEGAHLDGVLALECAIAKK